MHRDETPTRPPTSTETRAMEAFEGAIRRVGEQDTRLAHLAALAGLTPGLPGPTLDR